jgi:RNA-binding protein 39
MRYDDDYKERGRERYKEKSNKEERQRNIDTNKYKEKEYEYHDRNRNREKDYIRDKEYYKPNRNINYREREREFEYRERREDEYYRYNKDRNRERNRERERDRYHRSHSSSHSKNKERSRSNSKRKIEKERNHKIYSKSPSSSQNSSRNEIINKTIKEGIRQMEEAESFDRTILMYSFPNEVNEKKIFNFFASYDVLPIIDIKLLRDSRTGRSKNCCYVEFDTKERAKQALNLTGQLICGQPCQIVSSQAEKNRQALALKLKKEKDKEKTGLMNNIVKYSKSNEQIDINDAPMKIYVGGLTENLSNITEDDLCNIFGFGEIDSIELHKDPITGKSKGYAFIQFHRGSKAKEVIQAMNGFVYQGKALKVGEANENNTVIKGKMLLAEQQRQQQLAQQQLQQQMMMINNNDNDNNINFENKINIEKQD